MRIHHAAWQSAFVVPVTLQRGDGASVVFTLRPLPLGFSETLRLHGVSLPSPPLRVARDAQGKPLRDERGLVLFMAEEQDAGYRSACELYHRRVAVLAVVEALAGDANIEFEAARPEEAGADWNAWADALWLEFVRAGWTAGEFQRLSREVCRISQLLDDHLATAEQHFFSAAAAPA